MSGDVAELRRLPASDLGSPMVKLQGAYVDWLRRTGIEPDFLVVPGAEMKTLRKELEYALRMEMPAIDEMRKIAATGELVIGSFVTVIGPRYGAGKWV